MITGHVVAMVKLYTLFADTKKKKKRKRKRKRKHNYNLLIRKAMKTNMLAFKKFLLHVGNTLVN